MDWNISEFESTSVTRPGKSQIFRRCLIVVCLFLGLLVVTMSVNATPPIDPNAVDTLRQMQKQIDQQQVDVSEERDRLSTVEQEAQERLSGIWHNIQATNTAYKDYTFQIQLANRRLKELQVDLAQAERVYYQKQASTVARLRFLQRQQTNRFGLDILLKSNNLNEFLDRRRRVKLVYQADQQILLDLQAQAKRLQAQRADIEQHKNKVALLTQQLLAQKQQFEAQLAAQQELIERLKSDKQALKAAQAQLTADSEGIGILIRQINANKARLPKPVTLGTGQLVVPGEGTITSSFGWRQHPILGYSRFHSGIDFGASYGSTVRAADNGTVIFSGWYGGYGYAVVIDHGEGIATLYGHSSKLYVAEGQAVQRGEAIAAVGSTGLSTGPHLHFEVRKDGEPVDPMSYL